MEPISTTTAVIGAGAWFGNKLLGPTIEKVGTDLKQLYEKGRDRIVENAIKKTKEIEDSGQTNLRVTRDVFWNGSFTDESICSEYFGGILASSRSADGKDDTGVFYVDIIKSLSSDHLKAHYLIYRMFNNLLLKNESKRSLNPGQAQELVSVALFVSSNELFSCLASDPGAILHALYSKGLVGNFQTDQQQCKNNRTIPYLKVSPTPLGIQLFAIAYNEFQKWREFSTFDFGDFDGITIPVYYKETIESLVEFAESTFPAESNFQE